MSAAPGYLLDTNIVLHATRENSPVSAAVDAQFQLRTSAFRPTICEVTVAEMLAFANSSNWGEMRKERLRQTIHDLLVIPIADARIHQRWADLYSHAKANGLAIQHDHNDIWIAAVAHVTGLKLLSTDGAAFLPLRNTPWLDVVVLNPMTGLIVP
jgi:predicted nucleic acid-binding protein